MSEETVKVSEFELTKTPYTKIDQNGNSIKKQVKKRRVQKTINYKEL